jgi:chemotaxis signal transduction protein
MIETSAAVAVLPLGVAGEPCAVPALAVLEVLGARRVVAIPGAPLHFPGVMAWRGRAVAVLDLGVLLGKPPRPLEPPPERSIVVGIADGVVALPAELVEGVAQAEPGAFRPAHITRHRFAETEVDLGPQVLPVLDLGLIARAVIEREGM